MSIKILQLAPDQTVTVDGSIDMIYGGLGSGKTYMATADVLRDLADGIVVFTTWPIKFDGIDETHSRFRMFFSLIFPWTKKYLRIDKSNHHYVPLTDPDFMQKFQRSTDCVWYVDEAYAVIDSYVKNKMTLQDRFGIYGTRHFNRRLVLVAQRPNSIHVVARAMVNRFYHCSFPFPWFQKKLLAPIGLMFFVRTLYEDMKDESVDEEKPLSTRLYRARGNVFKAYDTKYLRAGVSRLFPPKIEVLHVSWLSRLVLSFSRRSRAEARFSAPSVPIKSPISDIIPH